MKKLIVITIIGILFSVSCTKDISSLNEETKRAASIPPGPLFTNAVKTLSDGLVSTNVNVNIFRHIVKHWAQAVIQEEAQYDYITRASNQSWWTRMYTNSLNDLSEAASIISESNILSPDQKANQLAIIDIMEIFTFNILLNTFGDIPYTEALNDEILFPVYDDAEEVYRDLMQRLNNDIAALKPAAAGFAASEDLFYQGSVARWLAFANSLKMRMAMVLADVDLAAAKTAFEQAEPGAMTSINDNAILKYLSSVPNNNPLYNDLVLAGRTDYIAAKDLMDVLIGMEDPRISGFFGLNNSGEYAGGVVGQASIYSNMSRPSSRVAAPDAPNVMMDYIEMEFLRAEGKERGFNVSGTAQEHYNNAIRASILYWGGTTASADLYIQRADVDYTTASGDWKQKIGFQKWIALYNRPFDGWVELRRLDHPQMPLPVGAISGFPNRLRYPGNEQQLNGTNYTNAAANIGGDMSETKLFWDKF